MPEEFTYIMSRKEQQSRFPGNTLPRPGLLLNPWVVGSTETDTQTALAGDAFGHVSAYASESGEAERELLRARRAKRKEGAGRGGGGGGRLDGDGGLSLDFLSAAGVTLANLPVSMRLGTCRKGRVAVRV